MTSEFIYSWQMSREMSRHLRQGQVLSLFDKADEPVEWGAAKKAYLEQVALLGQPAAPSTSRACSSDGASSGMD